MENRDLTLYGITQELDALDELISQDHGEITEEHEALMQSIEDSLILKTDAVVGYVQRELDLISIADKRIKELQAYKKSSIARIDRFKEYVKICLERTGKDQFEGTLNTIKLRRPSKVVKIVDENKLPPQYLKSETIIKVDKTCLKDDLKNGAVIDGAELVDGVTSVIFGLRKGK